MKRVNWRGFLKLILLNLALFSDINIFTWLHFYWCKEGLWSFFSINDVTVRYLLFILLSPSAAVTVRQALFTESYSSCTILQVSVFLLCLPHSRACSGYLTQLCIVTQLWGRNYRQVLWSPRYWRTSKILDVLFFCTDIGLHDFRLYVLTPRFLILFSCVTVSKVSSLTYADFSVIVISSAICLWCQLQKLQTMIACLCDCSVRYINYCSGGLRLVSARLKMPSNSLFFATRSLACGFGKCTLVP